MKYAQKLLPVALLALSASVQAAVTITIKEVGDDVVVTGSGSIDSDVGLTYKGEGSIGGPVSFAPLYGIIATTQTPPTEVQLYSVEDSPNNFGTGEGDMAIATGSGSGFWLTGLVTPAPEISGLIGIPVNASFPYPVDFELTFENQTLSSLGANPGRYEWTWGTAQDGVNGDSVTLCIGDIQPCPAVAPPTAPTVIPVPALGVFGLMGLAGALGAAGVAMNRRRKKA